MPYEIRRMNDEYCVHKSDDGQRMGCHDSREKAEAQMTALNIAESEKTISMLDRVKKNIDSLMGYLMPEPSLDLQHGAFKALGDGLWMAAHTNNFLDREEEILTGKAHLDYVDRVQRGFVDMPDLWFYHIPGSKHGKAIWIDAVKVDDGPVVVIALGEFDKTPAGKAAEQHYIKAGPGAYVLSHGFLAPEWARTQKNNKRYVDVYNTFEITTLPAEDKAEANQYTAFDVKEIKMQLPDEKRAEIEARFGIEMIEQIEKFAERVEQNAKSIADMGIEFKDFVQSRKEDDGDSGDVEPQVAESSEAEVALISELMQDVDATMDGQEQLTAAMQNVLQSVQALDSRLTEALAGVEKQMKSFGEFMQQTPSGVDDSEPIEDDEPGLSEAQKNMKERQAESTKEQSKFWGFEVQNTNGNQS